MRDTRYANVLVNPAAGGGKCGKLYPAAVDRLQDAGVKCKVTVGRYPGELMEVATGLAMGGHETVIACGGDGTVNEVINGIAGSETALGVVPLGMVNDFAGNLGLNQGVDHTCGVIRERRTRKIDLVRINQDRFFCGTACLGFDAEVASFARSRKVDPFLMNLLGGLVKFFSYEPKTVELRFDGQRFFGDVFLVAFGNVKSWDGDLENSPEAAFDDALLDIYLVRRMPKRKLLSIFPSMFRGGRPNTEGIEQHQTKAVFVQSVGHADLYADGDFVATTPVRLEVVPDSLKVIVGLPQS